MMNLLILFASLIKFLRLWGAIQYLVMTNLFVYISVFFISKKMSSMFEMKINSKKNILVFNSFRWKTDLKILHETGEFNLLDFKRSYISFFAIFFNLRDKYQSQNNPYLYHFETDKKILKFRKKKYLFAKKFLNKLKNKHKLHALLNCNFWYEGDQEWLKASENIGLKTIVLFKEFTVIDKNLYEDRIKLFKNFLFHGSYLCVSNSLAKEIFSNSLKIDKNKIKTIGLLRMDRIFSKTLKLVPQEKKIITFFSFGHMSGGLPNKYRKSHMFSNNRDYGFVNLFEGSHKVISKLALKYPDIDFYIKPKLNVNWWTDEIDQVIISETGKTIDQIKNLNYSNLEAGELIQKSILVIGFNSTVILESIAMGQATIVPNFGEVNKYPKNVYFSKYKNILNLSNNEEKFEIDIINAIKDNSKYKIKDNELVSEMMQHYFGYDDGICAQRITNLIKN